MHPDSRSIAALIAFSAAFGWSMWLYYRFFKEMRESNGALWNLSGQPSLNDDSFLSGMHKLTRGIIQANAQYSTLPREEQAIWDRYRTRVVVSVFAVVVTWLGFLAAIGIRWFGH